MSKPPVVTVLAVYDPETTLDVQGLLDDLDAQDGASATPVLLDLTDDGGVASLAADRAAVLRPATLSRGGAILSALDGVESDLVALRMPGSRANPAWLAKAAAALDENPDAQVVTSHYFLSRSDGQMAFNIDPARDGAAPPPGWSCALVFRKAALQRISGAAFGPTLLALYRELLAEGAVHHIEDALYSVTADWFALARFQASWDHNCLDVRSRDFDAPEPWVSLMVEGHGDRAAARRLLHGLGRQVLPTGTHEVVYIDRGDGALAGELAQLETFVALDAVDAQGLDAAAALNRGLERCRGMIVILLDEQLTVFPDTVEQHVRAHRENDPRELAVLGTLEVRAEDQQYALPLALADGSVERGRAPLAPGLHAGPDLLDRRNLSVPRAALSGVGGFGADVPDASLDLDLGKRLDDRGVSTLYRENARALRQSVPDLPSLAAARREGARAWLHAVARHPDLGAAHMAAGISREPLTELLEANLSTLPAVFDAAASLGALKLSSFDPIGEDWRELSNDLLGRLGQLLTHLDRLWQAQGWLQALDELEADSLGALVARTPEQVPGLRSRSWLLAPQSATEDAWLMAMARFLTGADARTDATLLVLAQAGEDGCSIELIQNAASELTRRVQPPRGAGWPHVLIVSEQDRTRPLARLVAATDGWVPTGSEFDAIVAEAAALADKPEVDPEGWALLSTGGLEPYPVQTAAARRVVAWPSWSDADDLDVLLGEHAKVLVEVGAAALCLRFVEGADGDSEQALVNLDEAFQRHFDPTTELEVFLFNDGLEGDDLRRLGVSVDGVLLLPSAQSGARAAFVEALGAPPLPDSSALRTRLLQLPRERPAPLLPAVTWTL